jgi:hypothetical protein
MRKPLPIRFLLTGNDVYKVLKGIARNNKITLLKDKDQSLANNDIADLVMEKEYKVLLQRAIDRLPDQKSKFITW